MNQAEQVLMKEILAKKRERSIYIIAHYYQRDEIQDIADFVGDSYAMALAARNASSDTILVAGVDFMAETAAILCPGKTVLSPEPTATCPMANSITAEQIVEFQKQHPNSIIMTYVNTPADVKAVSDVCCTSSNAEKILRKLPADKEVYFVPDQNLAYNVSRKLGRKVAAYPSCCPIHDKVTPEEILDLKARYPEARVLVHPECKPEVIDLADYAGSTAGILDYVTSMDGQDYIIGTEQGIFHAIKKNRPGVHLIPASPALLCPNMKSITLEKILHSIEFNETVITVPDIIRDKAVIALERMITLAS